MSSLRLRLFSVFAGLVPFALAGTDLATVQPRDLAARPTHSWRAAARAPVVIVVALDPDRDGVISAAEMVNSPILLAALDVDDDGAISAAELRGFSMSYRAAGGGRVGGRADRAELRVAGGNVLFSLDANRDGAIQSMEIANAVLSLRNLDRNGDGALDADELRGTDSRSTVE